MINTINNVNTIIRKPTFNHLYLNLIDELSGSSLTLLLKHTKNGIGIWPQLGIYSNDRKRRKQ